MIIVGAGSIGSSLCRGLMCLKEPRLTIVSRKAKIEPDFKNYMSDIFVYRDLHDVPVNQDPIFIAIPTNQLETYLADNIECLTERKVILLQAGNIEELLEKNLRPANVQFCRAITNINIAATRGHTLLLDNASAAFQLARKVFSKMGIVETVKTPLELNQRSIVSGCFPAMIASVITHLETAARSLGVDDVEIRYLIEQTLMTMSELDLEPVPKVVE